AQKVVISTATEGAVIYYTLDGTDPTEERQVYVKGEALEISESVTLKAAAKHTEGLISAVTEAVYVIDLPEAAAAPVFSIAAGTYTAAQKVVISTATEGAVIYYTLDGTQPTEDSAVYQEGELLTVQTSLTLKAVAKHPDGLFSPVTEAVYMIKAPEKSFIFTDVVPDGKWKHISVKYVWDRDIMNGISGTTLFNPDGLLNRAMFATVLYRMAGEPEVVFTEGRFSDVKPGAYYSNAVIWANQVGIVDGYTDGSYGVERSIKDRRLQRC
ncbi:MAG: chitobiase/beta-hexosaminidase C-terminal domain-containing protein, partial [Lachnospiraceae bacterium]|nr:chitobiase/beta-hexosaminidase C-terminal domain-containing protein [Lachnospiraceae bacterium]